MFQKPSIAAEVTLQPLRRFPLDGAILYADILLIPDALGLGLSFTPGEGPAFARPLWSAENWQPHWNHDGIVEAVVDKLQYVAQTIGLVKPQLDPGVTFLGFAGAPFTVASYMIEGCGGSKQDFVHTKKLLREDPELFHRMMDLLTRITIKYLEMQVQAGVEVVQLFESWSGALSYHQYATFCTPYVTKIIAALKPKVPVILFLGQGAALWPEVKKCAPSMFSVDWRPRFSHAVDTFAGTNIGLQGNLDPTLLLSTPDIFAPDVAALLQEARRCEQGYIFNLGHGCIKETPVENIAKLVQLVQETPLL
jgi:uroporphyrinogen decarboxylase